MIIIQGHLRIILLPPNLWTFIGIKQNRYNMNPISLNAFPRSRFAWLTSSYFLYTEELIKSSSIPLQLSPIEINKWCSNFWEDKAYQSKASLAEAQDMAIFVLITQLLAKKDSQIKKLIQTAAITEIIIQPRALA